MNFGQPPDIRGENNGDNGRGIDENDTRTPENRLNLETF